MPHSHWFRPLAGFPENLSRPRPSLRGTGREDSP